MLRRSALILAVLLPTAACGPPRPQASPEPSYPVVTGGFVALLTRLRDAPFAYAVEFDGIDLTIAASGTYDATTRRCDETSSIGNGQTAHTTRQIIVEDDIWTRSAGSPRWGHRTAAGTEATDPTGLSRLIEHVTDVRTDGPHSYLVRLRSDDESYLPVGAAGALGAVTGTAPVTFVAATDDAGRLTSLAMETVGGTTVVTTFSRHGEPVTVAAPAAR
ncbi:hypothetical protein [Actinoplanes sp. NBRC 101535]|uniref:hypothetical protein n=1 Tax=Actinoplanes sp. NBRC 101535 TaxID=3032196 RepID=UPI0024A129F1|nr:hypothetical protein [Actinoplanes sp. NBRC 101535]GLY00161.1 hypothetical protein Acsp01_05400 [Actinoplanes sp. NBRC 101535]